MDVGSTPGDRSLIVRVRHEQREIPDAPPIWRGDVTDVLTRERFAFARPEDLLEFLARRLGTSPVRVVLARWSLGPR